jgi:Meiotically up-regulated gene 113
MGKYDETKIKILNELRRLAAADNGKAPGQERFERETGIKVTVWRGKIWVKWSDVVAEAGFQPNQYNQAYSNFFLFEKLRECAAHFAKFPTFSELQFYKNIDENFPSSTVFGDRFDIKTMKSEFRDWLSKQPYLTEQELSLLNGLDQSEANIAVLPSLTNGFVYAIKFGEYYKIGRSNDIERRIKQINVALPEKGEIVHFIETDDPVGIEEYWHKRFDQYRENGEWFKLPDRELAAFKKRKFQ